MFGHSKMPGKCQFGRFFAQQHNLTLSCSRYALQQGPRGSINKHKNNKTTSKLLKGWLSQIFETLWTHLCYEFSGPEGLS